MIWFTVDKDSLTNVKSSKYVRTHGELYANKMVQYKDANFLIRKDKRQEWRGRYFTKDENALDPLTY